MGKKVLPWVVGTSHKSKEKVVHLFPILPMLLSLRHLSLTSMTFLIVYMCTLCTSQFSSISLYLFFFCLLLYTQTKASQLVATKEQIFKENNKIVAMSKEIKSGLVRGATSHYIASKHCSKWTQSFSTFLHMYFFMNYKTIIDYFYCYASIFFKIYIIY